MNINKGLAISFIIIILLAGSVLIKSRPEKKDTVAFDLSQIETITIKSEAKETILKKSGSFWLIETQKNIVADQKKIDNLLYDLGKLNEKELVSQNKDKWASFALDKDFPLITLGFADQSTKGFVVGKPSYERNGTFVREKDSDEILFVPVFLNMKLTQDWQNKQITAFSSFIVNRISIKRQPPEGMNLELTKNDQGEWREGEKSLSQEIVESFLSSVNYLEAEAVYPDQEKTFNPKLTIEIQADEETIKVSFDPQSSEVLVSADHPHTIYSITSSKYEEIIQALTQLSKK